MVKTPKPIECFIRKCLNKDCQANEDGECAWGVCFNVRECTEYKTRNYKGVTK